MTAALADAVGTLRIRTPRDEPAVRSAVSGAVRRAALHPPGRSPRAVLVVRRLVHQLPWESGLPAPTGVSAPGLAADVDAIWPLAGRPADDAVSATAPAVVFRDLAELLALFCEDLAGGTVAQRWWWDVVGNRIAPGRTVAEALRRHPVVVPNVLAELEARTKLPDVLAVITAAEAIELIAILADAHGAPRVAQAARRGLVVGTATGASMGSPDRPAEVPPRPVTPDRADARPLLVTVARLVATGDPHVRSAAFAEHVRRRLTGVAGTVSAVPSPGSPAVRRGPEPLLPATSSAGPVATERAAGADSPSGHGRHAHETPTGPAIAAPFARVEPMSGPADPPTVVEVLGREGDDDGPNAPEPYVHAPAEPAHLVTGLGGVFFLVDLLRELDLPDVCEQPWRLASRLGGWGTLELLARSIVPAEAPWPQDPIWRLLADLGGGAGALEPERSLPARVRGSLPAAWRSTEVPHAEGALSLDDSLAAAATQGLRRWLGLVRPFVIDVVTARSGLPAGKLFEGIIARRARIDADRTHVDVVLPLSSASVPVRRAGLDRDQGWVPQLGRVVSFHFEHEPEGL